MKKFPFCECGCGETVSKYENSFVKGHHRVGTKHSEEVKQKVRIAHCGKEMSEETREKMRVANLGKKHSEETKRKMSLDYI